MNFVQKQLKSNQIVQTKAIKNIISHGLFGNQTQHSVYFSNFFAEGFINYIINKHSRQIAGKAVKE